ncbi:phosphoribosylformylglycinamidine synthase [Ruminococcus difficilis]|uniref:Phosphoribosylformylglycinamidine synthase n=1 Tax=Ruminococcus difficilis TaxID=2763069 RepID=A0A934TZA5_9FIRM|nr:phosphoribosylformylglycinamidine synthase [Ruminococcus difficilis]MBK6088256.1 phosphoribosylformylglycinamidine synthase [Ruminococcus difficilis]
MVYRVFVEKKEGLQNEAKALLGEINELLSIKSLTDVRVINRYDAENITEELFNYAVGAVFSEPQLDIATPEIEIEKGAHTTVFGVEFLPGQFDQRADSAAQCIQIISQGDRPTIRSAKVYILYGDLTDAEIAEIKKYVINPVEAREAALTKPATLTVQYEIPTTVKTLDGFNQLDREGLAQFIADYGLAMDIDDIAFCQQYFQSEHRDPTITEIRMIDTYWSDHCRHTTFLTTIDSVKFEDELLQAAYNDYMDVRKNLGRTKPVCLMDLATIAVRQLKKDGKLDKLDESEEINACTVKMEVEVDGVIEPWLLLFKNETHNHPTEIEPFGGAATCIGGAIRDPLSGRAYVYGAMRVTGAADPTVPVSETIEGKLPQRKIVTTAAQGYSSYGNQIGLATGIVDEIYHPGYAAKRMEIGAVIAAAPAENIRREVPAPGDVVILLGGATGRDGIGGATGSSKAHNAHSVETCGAEVQKGNAPEERKLQRLFRNRKATRMIKRCNDFGAGGVSVAIGELADGLDIDLNAVPKKYEGLDGTELAISESQERMAVVVEPENVDAFLALAKEENLNACPVAVVKEEPRLTMTWNGNKIVDISREFLNSNGAEKHIDITPAAPQDYTKKINGSFAENMKQLASDLNICSKRGLSERFDSTIGAGTVLMPFGGKNQLTPIQAMVQKVSVEKKHTDTVSLMAWGYNPLITEKSPYHGAYLAVVESVSKLIATGASFEDVYLTFQEYFEKPGTDGKRWGKPLSALLGAFKAQMNLGIGSIGGKDSMSGSFEDLDVPPTLVSFAVTTDQVKNIISPEFKAAGHKVYLLAPEYDENGLPETDSLIALYNKVTDLMRAGKVCAAYTPTIGGIAEAVMKSAFGNGFGFSFNEEIELDKLFGYCYGAFLIETDETLDGTLIGSITDDGKFSYGDESVAENDILKVYEDKLEGVYSCNIADTKAPVETFSYTANTTQNKKAHACSAKPKVLIPAFPGTNCEYDSAKAMADAGADAKILVINNLSAEGIRQSVEQFARELKEAQMVFIPGGFSGGDEPDGSAKFITAFFRNAAVKEGVTDLLDNRGGLMCGICNGFQALIKLGLVPYGKIIDTDENCPTLTYNTISRHQSRIVHTRVASNMSPWLSLTNVGDVYNVPISHGEGRFYCSEELVRELAANGQIATQYVDLSGNATTDVHFNPNNSVYAIEGITSPDGRVFGKMGHSERWNSGLYQNVPGNYDIKMFESAVKYFKG